MCGHRAEVRDHGYVYEGTDIIAFCRTMEETTTALSTATARYFHKQQVVRRRTFSCLVLKELKKFRSNRFFVILLSKVKAASKPKSIECRL